MIVAPTREIALQVQQYLNFLCKHAPTNDLKQLSSELIIGGLDLKQQRKKLLVGRPNILVGTLGRISQMIDLEYISIENMEMLILDEADKFCQDRGKNKGNKK